MILLRGSRYGILVLVRVRRGKYSTSTLRTTSGSTGRLTYKFCTIFVRVQVPVLSLLAREDTSTVQEPYKVRVLLYVLRVPMKKKNAVGGMGGRGDKFGSKPNHVSIFIPITKVIK
jgi:hypothetical protein